MARPALARVPLVLLLIGGVWCLAARPIRSSLFFIVRFPLLVVQRSLSTLLLLPRLPSVVQDQRRLETELARRDVDLAQARERLRKHEQADALTHVLPERRGIIASVISRSFLPGQHTLLIDHGRRHGVVIESIVINATGVVGRVIESHDATAVVLLLTDAESRVAGMVERSRETGLLVGRLQGQCELGYLDAQADVQVGDRIVTAGLGGPFPKGLLLGTVMEVMRDTSSGEAWATVNPAARIGRVEDVFCAPP